MVSIIITGFLFGKMREPRIVRQIAPLSAPEGVKKRERRWILDHPGDSRFSLNYASYRSAIANRRFTEWVMACASKVS